MTRYSNRRTEREKNLLRLHSTNGMRLTKHPVYHFLTEWMTVNIRELPSGIGIHSPETLANQRKDQKTMPAVLCNVGDVALTIEELNAMLREANAETDISLEAIGKAYNKIKAIAEVLTPSLHQITLDLRQSRMSTEAEMKETLKWLTTVREFFLESKYEVEMHRLREFVNICKEIQKLKEAGILDAVADLAIRLAIREKEKTS
jgi:hypothetical protein